MRTFLVIWIGQVVSRIGTAMTFFALLIWTYQQTAPGGNAATSVAMLAFFGFVPFVLVSPVAGVWIDRLDRRTIMVLADAGAGLVTAGLLLLDASGQLQIWHLYVAMALSGTCEAAQSPAYTALTTLLLPKTAYARASGLRSLAESGAQIPAPALGGVLLLWWDLAAVMLVDLGTFLIAMTTLLAVRTPTVEKAGMSKREGDERFWQGIRLGIRYIWQRPGLLGLALIGAGISFFGALTYLSILPAMVLARSGGDELVLAGVQSALGLAGVAGSLVISVWGGPRRKIHGVLLLAALSFLMGDLLFAVGRTPLTWIAAAAAASFWIPMLMGSEQAIWQTKVAPAVQGRVFGVQGMIRQSLRPVGYLLAGVLADQLLEPAMTADGGLAPLFGPLVGTGPGAGMALMFVGTAVLGGAMSLSGYLVPAVRNVEAELPDFDVADADLLAPGAAD